MSEKMKYTLNQLFLQLFLLKEKYTEDQFRELQQILEQVDKRFEQVDRRFEQMNKQMNQRFEQVDKQFEQMKNLFGQNEQMVTQLLQKVEVDFAHQKIAKNEISIEKIKRILVG
ncbi:hypothetical protein [Tepidibacillus sp. LV47]|uniref:hypothetical protein n=1 Tax=Tepidibacillus sp. LV47 TaxID=3398228 RepID=UPI003AAED281